MAVRQHKPSFSPDSLILFEVKYLKNKKEEEKEMKKNHE